MTLTIRRCCGDILASVIKAYIQNFVIMTTESQKHNKKFLVKLLQSFEESTEKISNLV